MSQIRATAMKDQAKTCGDCDERIKVDVIVDLEQGAEYFVCPNCGTANARD